MVYPNWLEANSDPAAIRLLHKVLDLYHFVVHPPPRMLNLRAEVQENQGNKKINHKPRPQLSGCDPRRIAYVEVLRSFYKSDDKKGILIR